MRRPSAAIGGHAIPADPLTPGLYCVATPIGNLEDITVRAVKTLAAVDLVLCEDTRTTGRLIRHYGIETRMAAYHDHNETARIPAILERLNAGETIALVSDAGTPLVSDPGFPLVRAVADVGLPIFTVPGPSALTAALSIAGLPTDAFCFAGFLPTKDKARRQRLEMFRSVPATIMVYEAPSRLVATLRAARDVLGDRPAAVARELTKRFEEVVRGTLSEVIADFEARRAVKGECVVMIDRAEPDDADAQDIDAALAEALRTMSVKDAADMVATALGLKRRDVYRRALDLKDRHG